MTVVESDDAMAHFHMCTVIASLSIEVNTGMIHSRGSVLKAAQRQYGVKARTKAKALEEMKAQYKEKYGREYGS